MSKTSTKKPAGKAAGQGVWQQTSCGLLQRGLIVALALVLPLRLLVQPLLPLKRGRPQLPLHRAPLGWRAGSGSGGVSGSSCARGRVAAGGAGGPCVRPDRARCICLTGQPLLRRRRLGLSLALVADAAGCSQAARTASSRLVGVGLEVAPGASLRRSVVVVVGSVWVPAHST